MWADIQYSLVGILQTQNMLILPVLIYKFNAILKINSNTFLMELDNPLDNLMDIQWISNGYPMDNPLSNYQGKPRQI